MKRSLFFSGAITAILVGVFSLAYFTAAASNKYSFNGRGIVKVNSTSQKTLSVHFSHMSTLASGLGLGNIVEVSINQAKIYKPNALGQLVRVTQGNIAVGEEVSITGKVRTDDRFVANKIVIRNRSFVITGTLKTYDFANKQLKVDVNTSTYRPDAFKNGTVTMRFPSSVKAYTGTAVKEPQDLAALNQNVRVEGIVVNNDEFEVSKITEL